MEKGEMKEKFERREFRGEDISTFKSVLDNDIPRPKNSLKQWKRRGSSGRGGGGEEDDAGEESSEDRDMRIAESRNTALLLSVSWKALEEEKSTHFGVDSTPNTIKCVDVFAVRTNGSRYLRSQVMIIMDESPVSLLARPFRVKTLRTPLQRAAIGLLSLNFSSLARPKGVAANYSFSCLIDRNLPRKVSWFLRDKLSFVTLVLRNGHKSQSKIH